MARCIYCGEKVGLFSKYHEACALEAETNHKIGVQSIRDCITAAVKNNQLPSELQSQVNTIASQYKLSLEFVGQAVLTRIDELCREEPLPTAQFIYIFNLCESMFGKIGDIQQTSPFCRSYHFTILNLKLSYTLWLVMQGMVEMAANLVATPCEVVLQPGEIRLAEFPIVLYQKSVMVSSHVGSYDGVGVRVASGLYYRFGSYSGHTISHPEFQNLECGFLVLTNNSMYFAGEQTTFRIPYNSVLRFKAYPDGLGYFRGIGAGMEEIFTTMTPILSGQKFRVEDMITLHVGWFLYNLVTFLTTPNRS